jgi:hypothetical protein
MDLQFLIFTFRCRICAHHFRCIGWVISTSSYGWSVSRRVFGQITCNEGQFDVVPPVCSRSFLLRFSFLPLIPGRPAGPFLLSLQFCYRWLIVLLLDSTDFLSGIPGTVRQQLEHLPKVGPTLDYLGLSRCILISKRHLLNRPFLSTDEAFTFLFLNTRCWRDVFYSFRSVFTRSRPGRDL